MGGDHGPAVVVPASVEASRRFNTGVTLAGRSQELESLLSSIDVSDADIRVVDAAETIDMDEHPATAARKKPASSIAVALNEVKEGRASAMVSAGNSGAVMAVALLQLGRLPGVDRPAIASTLPSIKARTLILDLGAVTDPRPQHLVEFAWMGQTYARRLLGIEDPLIGLLSNGEEPGKGNQFVQQVYHLLSAESGIRFHGNVEGKDVPLGTVDVVVTDGFTGNVALKVAEGVASLTTHMIREELMRTWPRKLAALALRPAFRTVRNRLDYSEIGGAPLLGINGNVIIAHGKSDEKAITNAIGVATTAAKQDLAGAIQATMANRPNAKREATVAPPAGR
jgi:glycerol-3-phosphate acyltransferase PlsX